MFRDTETFVTPAGESASPTPAEPRRHLLESLEFGQWHAMALSGRPLAYNHRPLADLVARVYQARGISVRVRDTGGEQ